MPNELNNENTPFQQDDRIYDQKIQSNPTPPPQVGIDVENQFFDEVIDAGMSSKLDSTSLDSFNQTARSRDEIYSLLDTMCQDATMSAVLETYAEDATEVGESGRIVWVDSDDSDVSKYITYLLDAMKVDKNIYSWVHSLCKYGDVYLRIYRESEYDNDVLFNKKQRKEQRKKNRIFEEYSLDNPDLDKPESLKEDINIKAYGKNDHFVHYLEMQPNPAIIFELTKFGKSYAYIKTDTQLTSSQNVYDAMNPTQNAGFLQSINYKFRRGDITIYAATEFVHGCLEDDTSRIPEEVTITTGDSTTSDESAVNASTYKVKRGKSLFYDLFKIWREMTLLENAVLLNRVTKSSVVRAIGVEIGDMPKENVGSHLQGIKRLFEQSESIVSGKSMSEYTNPGPIENNVYIPTRDGKGAISIQTVGGDVDVKGLADLDYFRDKLFGGLKVPKQYFGFTEDGAGFNGGTSLSIISSRYAKMIKRIQNTMVQTLTDAINIILIDRGLPNYINKFKLKMLTPTTQEELDRRENLASKVQLTKDTMDMLDAIEDPITKLKILKSLMSNYITDTEVITLIQNEITKLENQVEAESNPSEEESSEKEEAFGGSEEDLGSAIDMGGMEEGGEEPVGSLADAVSGEALPTPEDLGSDFTDNEEF